jgi:hypothetical protein
MKISIRLYFYLLRLRIGVTITSILISLLLIIEGNAVFAQSDKKIQEAGRVISFSGYDWLVKSSIYSQTGTMGPGNNYFSDSKGNVWVDRNGYLHLKIVRRNHIWYCAEVTLIQPFPFKKYIFQLISHVDKFHPNVVGGLFTYLDGTDNAEEIDIEFSKWGNRESKVNGQFSIQPTDIIGNTHEFTFDLKNIESTHVIDWKSGWVDFISYRGHNSSFSGDSSLIINQWHYSGNYLPVDKGAKVHLNLWLFNKEKIKDNDHLETEMIIKSFKVL